MSRTPFQLCSFKFRDIFQNLEQYFFRASLISKFMKVVKISLLDVNTTSCISCLSPQRKFIAHGAWILNFTKKVRNRKCFLMNFAKYFKHIFFTEYYLVKYFVTSSIREFWIKTIWKPIKMHTETIRPSYF